MDESFRGHNPELLLDWIRYIQDTREPDQVIGHISDPYLLRWHLIRTPEGSIYLHKFMRSDDDRALHDHPWPFRSFIVDGGYWEHLPGGVVEWRAPGTWSDWVEATHTHRVELLPNTPATTIFITGPKVRDWGFHCPQGWVPWQIFTSRGENGESVVGRGCE